MTTTAHEEQYNGLTIKLVYDESPESPREWDNLGEMACWHGRYNLGDKHSFSDPQDCLRKLADEGATSNERDWLSRAEEIEYSATGARASRLREAIDTKREEIIRREYVILPLFLYDHGGITMRTAPFACLFDSGQVGFIYCSMRRARKEYGQTLNDSEMRNMLREMLESEVSAYDSYLTGEVVGFVIEDESGEHLDSCWGFYPNTRAPHSKRYDDPLEEARSIADGHLRHREELETQLCANI